MGDAKGSNLSRANRIAAGIEGPDASPQDAARLRSPDQLSGRPAAGPYSKPASVDVASGSSFPKRGIGWAAASMVTPLLFFLLSLLLIAWLDTRGFFASSAPIDNLGVAVKVESSMYLQQQYGPQAVLVTITNVRTNPVVVNQVVFNGSSDAACVKQPNQTLREGGVYQVNVGGFFGMCGNIIRVTVKTDRGQRDYRFEP
jgi:hypothetical protein